MRICKEEGCEGKYWAKGYCRQHWAKEYNQKPEVKKKARERDRERCKRPEYKRRVREYLKEYNKRPEVTAKRKRYNKEYRRRPEVKERRKKYRKEWEEKNRDRLSKQRREYVQSPKGREKIRMANYKRRAMKKNVIHRFIQTEWLQKKRDTFGICPGYKRKAHWVGMNKLTIDHIYPLDKANDDYLRTGIKREYYIDDVAPLCGPCNSSKKKC